jgi:Ca2+-binding EF-hand superfamily protein
MLLYSNSISEQDVINAFQAFNKDGIVSENDLLATFSNVENFDLKMWKQLISDEDCSGTGGINIEQFKSYLNFQV